MWGFLLVGPCFWEWKIPPRNVFAGGLFGGSGGYFLALAAKASRMMSDTTDRASPDRDKVSDVRC